MKFFLDNCMSPHHAEGLQGFARVQHHEFVHLRTMFAPETKDVDWLRALGEEGGWIILSGDQRISRNPTEKRVWYESNLTAFFFGDTWARDQYWKKTIELVTWWPTIAAQADRTPSGHGFVMPKKGKELQQIYPR